MSPEPSADGVLIVDKPAGPTSHDVVAAVRRTTGWAPVGHTGTLDPLATGVLPLVIGRATRLAQFLSAADKVYEADIRLGWATDTYDAEGTPIGIALRGRPQGAAPTPVRADPRVGPDDLEAILDRFRGSYLQASPPFSAKKVDGVRAYSLARKGAPAPARQSRVTVYALSCIARESDRLRVRLWCSSGFYVRTFAHELGVALGTGAHLIGLRRTRSGDFDEAEAVSLDVVVAEEEVAARRRVIPLERLLGSMPAVVVDGDGAARVRHGNDIGVDRLVSGAPEPLPARVRVLDQDGGLLAIAAPSSRPGFLHPGVVVR